MIYINKIKPTINKLKNAYGIKYFQQMVISWSTLTRGKVQRNHICTKTKNIPLTINQKICSIGTSQSMPTKFPKYPNGEL